MTDASRRARPPAEDPEELSSLMRHLKETRGFDLSGYKRSTLERRIRRRMDAVKVRTYSDYEDYLEVHPDEFGALFDTLLINVTSFFRDEPAWAYLAETVIPKLIADTPQGRPLRVWSAGCASGEEAFTAAMVLADKLGDEEFRDRVKIYATDVDEDALSSARHAVYPPDSLNALPDDYLGRYFEPNTHGYGFRADLRRSVIFGRNDLVQDAPISRIDLLISRNTLMYFTAETQARILNNFHFSLRESGYLFLGKSEMLITHSELFLPSELKWRVFKKVPGAGTRDRLALIQHAMRAAEELVSAPSVRFLEGAADISPVPQLAVDENGFLAAVNQAARRVFGIGRGDLGRPIQDLEISYRPLELRSALQQVREQGEAVGLGRVRWRDVSGRDCVFEVDIAPVPASEDSGALGASVTFTDVTELSELNEHRQVVERQLESAYEELQSTVEELETTNEELQSTNEELETTNEELQSTNEELETMNEELQSTNDELEAVNEEQRERSTELDRLNLFLEGILGNLGMAVVVLDREQCVQLWNGTATDMWGLQERETQGQHILSLDIGFPVTELRTAVRDALSDAAQSSELSVEAVNRRGRSFTCGVRVLPLLNAAGANYGAMLLMSQSLPTSA
jgi:two-component system, chemotaxis family, CheB/CheR fusion protein